MERISNIPWPRIFAEGAAIVISILLAFWIEAWWSERQEKADERELLSSLRGEFQTLQQDVDWRLKYIEGIREAGRQLFRASSSTNEDLGDQQIDQLLNHLWYNQEVAPLAMPVLNSAISSGDLSLISARDLRRNVSSWSERLDRARNNMQSDLTSMPIG